MQIRTPYQRWIALLTVSLATIWMASNVPGQDAQPKEPSAATNDDAAPAAQEQDEEEAVTKESSKNETGAPSDPADTRANSILAMIVDSGATGVAFMGVLALFSLVAATVALERLMNVRRDRMIPDEFTDALHHLTQEPGTAPELFAELCKTTTAPISAILQAGVLRHGRSLLEIEKAMEDAAVREMSEAQAKIRPLRTVGNIAPLVGLLGTVVGMIMAFHTASQAGLGKAELLAKGIYMALLTTAGGLSVAIPSLLLGSFIGGRLEKFFREMDKQLMPAVSLLASSRNPRALDNHEPEPAREPEPAHVSESPQESEAIQQPASRKKSDNPLMSM
ncbi:MAG: MotA/TolQ/ExbB proton channel family protein [Pirellulaceae bacterium]|jgi:biopolymer transport protein ExbB/TolQ|nr:MotA/TolQ/ExbB proton channel family protein [Pirellulaceae bacterium]MDP6717240.1 MotA/TolQ/ExbB proton channel family protein [Pirellulaceae bacterium]